MMIEKKFGFLLWLGVCLWMGCHVPLFAASTVSKPFTEDMLYHPEAMNGIRFGTLMGSTQDHYVIDHYPQAQNIRIDMHPDLILSLKVGQTDMVAMSSIEKWGILHENPDLGVLCDSLFSNEIGACFSYDHPELLPVFNDFWVGLEASGIAADMRRRWLALGDYDTLHFAPGMEGLVSGINPLLILDGETHTPDTVVSAPLRIGVCGSPAPSLYMRNGRWVGFESELMIRFSSYLQRPIDLQVMNFAGLIPALKSGKIDMICNYVMITEERKMAVAFTDPYFVVNAMILCNKADLQSDSLTADSYGNKASLLSRMGSSFYRNIIQDKRYKLLVKGLENTLWMTFLSLILGTLLSVAVCALYRSKNRILKFLAKTYMVVISGIPVVLLLLISFYVVFASFKASAQYIAVITFAILFSSYMGELFSTGLDQIPKGQREAGLALGFSPNQSLWYIVIPQMVRQVLPIYNSYVIKLLKVTSIVGYIAIQDLTKASDIIRSRTLDAFASLIVISIVYFLLVWGISYGLSRLNQKMNRAGK